MRLVFYRYKLKFSYGHDKTWEYHYSFSSEKLNKDTILYIKLRLDDENGWSEHYRGCDVEVVYKIPQKIKLQILDKLKSQKNEINAILKQLRKM